MPGGQVFKGTLFLCGVASGVVASERRDHEVLVGGYVLAGGQVEETFLGIDC